MRVYPATFSFSLCILTAGFMVPVSLQAQITVNSASDVVDANDGLCTLREAIFSANTDVASGLTVGECAAGSAADTILLQN